MTHDTQGRIAKVSRWIEDTRRQVAANARVDLTGLDDRIEEICLAVRAPAARRDATVREALSGMLRQLDALESDLVRQRDSLTTRPAPTVAPNAAASAYGKGKPE